MLGLLLLFSLGFAAVYAIYEWIAESLRLSALGKEYQRRFDDRVREDEAKKAEAERLERDERLRLAAKTLDDDEYQIFLAREYAIERHVALGKFQVGKRLFPSLADALKFADHEFRSSLS